MLLSSLFPGFLSSERNETIRAAFISYRLGNLNERMCCAMQGSVARAPENVGTTSDMC